MEYPTTKDEMKRARMRVEFVALSHRIQPRGYSLIEVVGMLKQRKYRLTEEEKEKLKNACDVYGLDYVKIRVFKPK